MILALPYPSEARLGQALTRGLDETEVRDAYSDQVQRIFADLARHYRPDTVNLAVSHIFVAGGQESESERPIQLGGACTVRPSALPPAQYVALGHLHRLQSVRNAPSPTGYSGSPLAYSFSEAGQAKSVVVVEAEPGRPVATRHIHLSSGRPLVRWKATEGLAQVHRWLDEGRDGNAWIDLEVHVASPISPDQTQALRRAGPSIINIRPIFPEIQALAAAEDRSTLPLDELFRRFYLRQRGGGLPSGELVKLFLELVTVQSQEEKGNQAEGVRS
jgi:exonuclease SbcD